MAKRVRHKRLIGVLSPIAFFLFFIVARLSTKISYPLMFSLVKRTLSERRKEIASINIRTFLPHLSKEEQETLFLESLKNIAYAYVDSARAWSYPPSFWKKHQDSFEVNEGAKEMAKAIKEGPTVLFTMHCSALEMNVVLFGILFKEVSKKVHSTGELNPENTLLRYVAKKRGRYVGSVIDRSDQAAMRQSIKSKDSISYTSDHAPSSGQISNGLLVDFMGVPAQTVSIVPRMAKIKKARVFAYCTFRLGGSKNPRYRFEALELKDYPKGTLEEDVLLMNQTIELFVRKAPEQYIWTHERLRNAPTRENFYPKKNARKSNSQKQQGGL